MGQRLSLGLFFPPPPPPSELAILLVCGSAGGLHQGADSRVVTMSL